MSRSHFLLSGILLAIGAGLVWGVPVAEFNPLKDVELPPYAAQTHEITCAGNQRAAAICIGDGKTFLGLYVYDQHGNCVAREDINREKTCDDLAVEWYPSETSRYTVEVVNFGKKTNRYDLAVK